jgi:capsular polysaccharide biosynthesis protein
VRAHKGRETGRLAWLLRHYAWLVLICVLALAGLPLVLGAATATYQADAIVLASQLTVREQALPQLGTAVFSNGEVADRVAADPAFADEAKNLIPERLSVTVPQDSLVLIVQARDADPDVAARLANLGASAFVDELNAGGAGVGSFAVSNPAVIPSQPLRSTSPGLLAVTGALAGLVLGLGLAALLGVIRRPVVTSGDVEEAVGVPLLGRVSVPLSPPGIYPGPVGVRGIAGVTRWMAGLPGGRLLVISPRSAVAIRQRIFVMVAVALSTARPVRFRAARELVEAIEGHRARLRPASEEEVGADPAEIILVDGGSPMEILDPTITDVSVVAVAPRGITRRRLRVLADDYKDAGLVGVVLADVRPGSRGEPMRRVAPAVSPRAEGALARGPIVPEPERA